MAGARLAPLTQTMTSCLDLSNGWEASGVLSPLSDLLAGGVAGAKPEYSVQDQEQKRGTCDLSCSSSWTSCLCYDLCRRPWSVTAVTVALTFLSSTKDRGYFQKHIY